jgi:hypothetical protein
MRSVVRALHDPVLDAKTNWLYREQLARDGTVERLFERFDALLWARGRPRRGRSSRRSHGTPFPPQLERHRLTQRLFEKVQGR